MGKSKKLLTKREVRALTAQLNVHIKSLKKGGRKVNIDNIYLLGLLEKARQAIIQLNRPMRDYS